MGPRYVFTLDVKACNFCCCIVLDATLFYLEEQHVTLQGFFLWCSLNPLASSSFSWLPSFIHVQHASKSARINKQQICVFQWGERLQFDEKATEQLTTFLWTLCTYTYTHFCHGHARTEGKSEILLHAWTIETPRICCRLTPGVDQQWQGPGGGPMRNTGNWIRFIIRICRDISFTRSSRCFLRKPDDLITMRGTTLFSTH